MRLELSDQGSPAIGYCVNIEMFCAYIMGLEEGGWEVVGWWVFDIAGRLTRIFGL